MTRKAHLTSGTHIAYGGDALGGDLANLLSGPVESEVPGNALTAATQVFDYFANLTPDERAAEVESIKETRGYLGLTATSNAVDLPLEASSGTRDY